MEATWGEKKIEEKKKEFWCGLQMGDGHRRHLTFARITEEAH